MAEREGADREQAYHELLGDMQQLLLLQNLIEVPLSVAPVFGIIWGAIEALVTDLAHHAHADIPATRRAIAELRRGHEIDWRALDALVTDLAGRRPAHLDERAASSLSALRRLFGDALDAARTLAGLDRHHPLWGQAHEASGGLLTALTQIKDQSTALMQLADPPTPGRVGTATRHQLRQPITPAPPAPPAAPGGSPRRLASPPGQRHRSPGRSGGMPGLER